ncbi:MAG: acyltransferase family protein [Bacteroidales bacterium]
MSRIRTHFHTFDALRLFSFLLVFLHHSPVPESSPFSYFSKSGGIGVVFFFVLSGFLITYILLEEKVNKGKISLKKFYVRRILRIWPLFYAMILFAYLTPYLLDAFHFSYSSEGYQPNWLMSVLFLENYKMMITGSFPNVSPLGVMWSLCIEEHFYLIWGILIATINVKRIPVLILVSVLLANVCRIIYMVKGIATIDIFTNIDYFAFGAIPAYLLVFKNEWIGWLEQLPPAIKYGVAIIAAVLIFLLPHIHYVWVELISPFLLGATFSLLILFTLPPNNCLKISDNAWLSRLGVYTYGLYLFHTIVINFFHHTVISQYAWPWFICISLVVTILISMLSYHIFEKQFLRLKAYFY